ncbi:MAG: T9SS type A sorting domain-containing protein [Candidatus Kapabacteria bacterium]|nr:T9SS type A sorting domain-containing protein [Candidatus Kapabacteria bacterium]
MKNLILYFLTVVITVVPSFAQDLSLPQFPKNVGFFYNDIDVYGDRVVVLLHRPQSTIIQVAEIDQNNSWKILLDTIQTPNGKELAQGHSGGRVRFDRNGKLWLTAFRVHSFEQDGWRDYSVFPNPLYDSVLIDWYFDYQFDKNNLMYVQVERYNKGLTGKNKTEIMTFDGANFDRKNFSELYPTMKTFTNTAVDVETPFTFDGNNLLFQNSTNAISSRNLAGELSPMYPNYGLGISPSRLELNQIHQDEDGTTFVLLRNAIDETTGQKCCGGLHVLKDGVWKYFDESDGYPTTQNGEKLIPWSMAKAPNGEYFFLMQSPNLQNRLGNLYKLSSNNRFEEVPMDAFFKETTVFRNRIVTNPIDPDYGADPYRDERIDSIFRIMKKDADNQESYYLGTSFKRIRIDGIGNIWLLAHQGLLLKSSLYATKTGVEETESEEIRLFPNPTNTTLSISGNTNDITSVQILNINGQIVQTSSNKKQVSVSHLSAGVYLVKMTMLDGSIKTSTFIKQN